jgi:hypothetical protein
VGLEPTYGLSNSQVPYQFSYLRMVGVVRIELTCACTQDRWETSSRHSVEKIDCQRSRTPINPRPYGRGYGALSSDIAPPVRAGIAIWGDRRESNSRGLVHSQPPEPLGLRPHLERSSGIEPESARWHRVILPLNDDRELERDAGIQPARSAWKADNPALDLARRIELRYAALQMPGSTC